MLVKKVEPISHIKGSIKSHEVCGSFTQVRLESVVFQKFAF